MINVSTVSSIEELPDFEDEYVYDIGIIGNTPYFFGNNILVHNSSYFSIAYLLEDFKEQGIDIDKDSFLDIANNVAESVNQSFPDFIEKSFHVMGHRKEVIKCGREIAAEAGLFVRKKRYAILYYDKDNVRYDINGKDGKMKIMGMDTQRSDTPEPIQIFLTEVLQKVLSGKPKNDILQFITDQRDIVKNLQPWEKGTPKRVNNLTNYTKKLSVGAKVTIPGHVRGAINWNVLKDMHGDKSVMSITDGQKVIVCKLKGNPLNFSGVAVPTDEFNIPQWFKDLPFDNDHMEQRLIDQKLQNLIGVLGWDLSVTRVNKALNDFFTLQEE